MTHTVLRATALVLCLLVSAASLGAATRTWTGAADALWSNPANWQEGVVPAAGDALVFAAAVAAPSTNDLPSATYSSLTVTSWLTLEGNAISVGSGGITVHPTNDFVVFDVPVIAAEPQTWTCTGGRTGCELHDAVIDSTVTLVSPYTARITARGRGTIVQQSGESLVTVGRTPVWSGTILPQGGSLRILGSDPTEVDVEMNVPCEWSGCTADVTLSGPHLRSVNAAAGQVRVAWGQDATLPGATLDTLYLGPGSALDVRYQSQVPSTMLRVANPLSVAGIPLSLGTLLRLSSAFRTPGSVLTLIDYTGAGPVGGTFAGLPEGATLRSRTSQRFRISYAGGDGNDITLTALEHYSGRTDFDGNGASEIFWRHAVTGQNYRWTMDGAYQSGVHVINQVPDTDWKVAATADFDGDGDGDVLWRHAQTGEVYMYLMQGGAIEGAGPVNRVDTAWQILGTGDFDGDSRGDVFWRNGATGQTYVWFMNGRTIEHAGPIRDVPVNFQAAGMADFNTDGTDDIVWHDASTGEIYIWLLDDLKIAGEGRLGIYPDWYVAGVGQFSTRRGILSGNTDHKADIILRNAKTGRYQVHLLDGTWWNARGHSLGFFFGGEVDPAWKIVSTGDYNRDGVSDILWRHSVTGENYLYLVTGTSYTGHALPTVPDTNWQIVP